MTDYRRRPDVLRSKTKCLRTPCGKMYATLCVDDDGQPAELFLQLGKAGGCVAAWCEIVARLVTKMLRHGIPLSVVIKQMHRQQCFRGGLEGQQPACLHAVAEWLIDEEHKAKGEVADQAEATAAG